MTSPPSAKDVFTAFIKAIGNQDLPLTASHLASDATYNDKTVEELLEQLRATWEAAKEQTIEIDTMVVDKGGKAVAARLIHRGILKEPVHGIQVSDGPIEASEHIMVWTNGYGKISRIQTLIDTQHQASESLPRTPSDLVRDPAPPGFDLAAMYHNYIAVVNGSSIREELPKYFQPNPIHTTREWTIDSLADFLETSPTLFEGLKLSVADLLVDEEENQVAVRILFEGVPVKPFFGLGPPKEKKKVSFFEHAFYKLDSDKFKFIWAMLDLVSYERQIKEAE
jgi:predicted ester cyclase